MTTAEYLQTPETVLPRELAYGELRVAEAPAVPHQRVVGRLSRWRRSSGSEGVSQVIPGFVVPPDLFAGYA